MTNLLYQLKYHSVKGLGTYLGNLLYYAFNVPLADLIVSVPLHPRKKFYRGFNQAEVIAKQLARNVQLPWLDLLVRNKNTKAQATGMNKAKRAKNTQGLYALNKKVLAQLHGKIPETILMIDDVITTGSTLNACAKVLKAAGAKKVIGLAVTHRG